MDARHEKCLKKLPKCALSLIRGARLGVVEKPQERNGEIGHVTVTP